MWSFAGFIVKAQLADALTKNLNAGTLRSCMRSGKYAFFDEHLVLKERADKRAQHEWYRNKSTLPDALPGIV